MTDATAEALAPEADMGAENPEQAQDAELAAIYDKAGEPEQEEAVEDILEPEVAETDPPEPVEEPEAEKAAEKPVEAPGDLPKAIRDHWGDIPEAAREAFVERQRDMAQKLGDQGRMVQGIAPIRDVLVEASRQFPTLANMRPEQVAQEVMELSRISHQFNEQPVETILGLARQHGIEQALAQALQGHQPQPETMQVNSLQQEIRRLNKLVEGQLSPEHLQQQFSQFSRQSQAETTVSEFAAQAEHWSDVEDKIPAAIQFVQQSAPSASPSDTLRRAYDLAVSQFLPEAKAPQKEAVEQTAPVVDPEKTKAALKAKSVNVQSKPGKPRPLTEEQELAKVWDRMQDN